MRTYDERSAEELLRRGLAELELTVDEVRELNNVDLRKQALAWMVKTRSVVTHVWVSKRLEMAHRINVTRALQRTCDACVVNSRGWCTKRHGVRRIRVRARAPCYNADRPLLFYFKLSSENYILLFPRWQIQGMNAIRF